MNQKANVKGNFLIILISVFLSVGATYIMMNVLNSENDETENSIQILQQNLNTLSSELHKTEQTVDNLQQQIKAQSIIINTLQNKINQKLKIDRSNIIFSDELQTFINKIKKEQKKTKQQVQIVQKKINFNMPSNSSNQQQKKKKEKKKVKYNISIPPVILVNKIANDGNMVYLVKDGNIITVGSDIIPGITVVKIMPSKQTLLVKVTDKSAIQYGKTYKIKYQISFNDTINQTTQNQNQQQNTLPINLQ